MRAAHIHELLSRVRCAIYTRAHAIARSRAHALATATPRVLRCTRRLLLLLLLVLMVPPVLLLLRTELALDSLAPVSRAAAASTYGRRKTCFAPSLSGRRRCPARSLSAAAAARASGPADTREEPFARTRRHRRIALKNARAPRPHAHKTSSLGRTGPTEESSSSSSVSHYTVAFCVRSSDERPAVRGFLLIFFSLLLLLFLFCSFFF